ncbi:unnamed protein product [Cylicostephanus goldi]|uniref:Uncharacterized protein n=1 Tax=Cylicostephanus goldi TaxID=71465 RepID=A0A3P6RCI2_CYLGO|nr:unnamed protein product [Cylicostephanus goldi]
MPKLETQNAAENTLTTPAAVASARNSPAPKSVPQRPVAEAETALALQSFLLAHVKEEVKKEKKQREKKGKQKEKRKLLQQEELEQLRKQEQEIQEQQRIAEAERLEKERIEQLQAEEKARLHLLELTRDTATPPMREVPEASPKSLKIVISNPHSDSASSAFSPPRKIFMICLPHFVLVLQLFIVSL